MTPGEEVLSVFSEHLTYLKEWFMSFSPVIAGCLVAAAVIYTTFLAWRKYRAATNRV